MPPRGPVMGGVNTRVSDNKTHDVKYVLRGLWKYLYRYRMRILGVLLLSLFSNALAILGPRLSGMAIDAITEGESVDFPQVFKYSLLMLGFYVLSAGLGYIISVRMVKLSQRIVTTMRTDAFESVSRLPVGYTDVNAIGDILSKISYDIDTINTSLSHDVVQILSSLITVFGSLYMMFLLSPLLLLVFCVTVPLSIFITKFITSRTRPLFRARSRKLGELNGFVEEMVSGLKTAKAYHREQYTIDRFDQKNEEAVEAYYKSEYYGSVTGPSVNFVNNLSLSLVSVFGVLLYISTRGGMSLGDISSFVLYSRRFSGPINETANIIAELQSALAAGERVFKLIDETPEPPDTDDCKELDNVRGLVEMKHVSFGYVKDKIILHDLSLTAKPGSVTAIVGPTGAGKTTIINLLMRFYDRNSGEILIDGMPIEKITRKSLRKSFAMVLQDTWLFEGTVYDNVAYGSNASREDVERACKLAKISHFIEQLPNGYDTVLTENGGNISKGQKQLLTIARAMLLDAKMLILDEATSNVDTQTELGIQAAMLALMKNKTCFVIAHRLSTIRNADNILVLNKGDIVEQGTHDELIEKGGFYEKLYSAQFEN